MKIAKEFDTSFRQAIQVVSRVNTINAIIAAHPGITRQLMLFHDMGQKEANHLTELIVRTIYEPARAIFEHLDRETEIIKTLNASTVAYRQIIRSGEDSLAYQEAIATVVSQHLVSIAWLYSYFSKVEKFLASYAEILRKYRIPSIKEENAIKEIHLRIEKMAENFSLPFVNGTAAVPFNKIFSDDFFASGSMVERLQFLQIFVHCRYEFERNKDVLCIPNGEAARRLKIKLMGNILPLLTFYRDTKEVRSRAYQQGEAWGVDKVSIDAVIRWLEKLRLSYGIVRKEMSSVAKHEKDKKANELKEYLRLVCATENNGAISQLVLPLLGITSAEDMWEVARILATSRGAEVLKAEGKEAIQLIEILIAMQSEFADCQEFPGHDEIFKPSLTLPHAQLLVAEETPEEFISSDVIAPLIRVANSAPKVLALETESVALFFKEELLELTFTKESNNCCITCVFEEFKLEIYLSSLKTDATIDWNCIYPFTKVKFRYKYPLHKFLLEVISLIEKGIKEKAEQKRFKPDTQSPASKKGLRREKENGAPLLSSKTATPQRTDVEKRTEQADGEGIKLKVVAGFSKLKEFADLHTHIDIEIFRRKLDMLNPSKLEKLADTYQGLTCFRAWLDRRIRVILAELPESIAGERHFEIITVDLRDDVYDKFRRL